MVQCLLIMKEKVNKTHLYHALSNLNLLISYISYLTLTKKSASIDAERLFLPAGKSASD